MPMIHGLLGDLAMMKTSASPAPVSCVILRVWMLTLRHLVS